MTNWLTAWGACLAIVAMVTSAAGAADQSVTASSSHHSSMTSFYPTDDVIEHGDGDGERDSVGCEDPLECGPETDLMLDLAVDGSRSDWDRPDEDRPRQVGQSIVGKDRWRRDLGHVRSSNAESYEISANPFGTLLRHPSPVRAVHLQRRPVRQEPLIVVGRAAAAAPLRQRRWCPDDDVMDGIPDIAYRSATRHRNNGNVWQTTNGPRAFWYF